MPLMLPDTWTWDFWVADTGEEYHLFFLRASKALQDPERRHRRAGVGHAVSKDLRSWDVLADALVHTDGPDFDDLATWTGSVTRHPAGGWRMFYTGISRVEDGGVQRISWADSPDLLTWQRSGTLLEADGRWYEKREAGQPKESWRDPWVFADPAGDGWHMLITARANTGDPLERGVVGHARSADLDTWTVQPPLSSPDGGFGQLEVLQLTEVEGRPVLVFSCLAAETALRRSSTGPGGVWTVPLEPSTGSDDSNGSIGPFDLNRATALTGPERYAGRIVTDRDGRSVLLGFVHNGPDGGFVGGLPDPSPVRWQDGTLTVS